MKTGHNEKFVKDPMKSKDFYVDKPGFIITRIQKDKFIRLKSGCFGFFTRHEDNLPSAESFDKSKIVYIHLTRRKSLWN